MAKETNPAAVAAQSADYVDDLFDYEVGLDDMLQETNASMSSANVEKQSTQPDNSGVFLGLDEEVEVAKKRQPVAKLDENRLLSQAGIPKLRRSAKKSLKFKGKGHEFSDLARLLNFYQLWLDDLFPRAKFADGLAIIERLGHSKRLQTMRRAWIDEEKPKSVENTSRIEQMNSNDNSMTSNNTSMADNRQSIPNDISRSPGELIDTDEDLFLPDSTNHQQSADKNRTSPDDNDEFDELDALLRERRDEPDIGKRTSTGGTGDGHCSPDDDDFAELDALLREHEAEHDIDNLNLKKSKNDSMETDSHADELEAIEGTGLSGLMK
ncbi:hypothetical protein BDW72DRAFT_39476 [Aspergillus terricola var. indicus]